MTLSQCDADVIRVIAKMIDLEGYKDSARSLYDIADRFPSLMGVERAAPPLRAREEIARIIKTHVFARMHPGFLLTVGGIEEAADALSGTAGQEWRDISSAPKDGTRVLLWCRDIAVVAHYDFGDEAWIYAITDIAINPGELSPFFCSYASGATHWMPLPAPPVAEPIVADKSEVK